MKTTKIIISILIVLTTLNLSAQEKISNQQNKNNLEYLEQLDANLTGTIQMLQAFNKSATIMPDFIDGANLYSQFLMERTMDCSNLKKNIADSQDLEPMDREIVIELLISFLNPDVKLLPFQIDEDKDLQNRALIKVMHKRIVDQVVDLQKKILNEEQGIVESETFNKYFFNLHSQHFVYQLLLDFMEPSEKLSKDNRNYLLTMIRTLEDMMMDEKIPEENSKEVE
ncbi:hypothetical protein ACFLYJ_03345 [Candidatus Cloacimonadota bacterium]